MKGCEATATRFNTSKCLGALEGEAMDKEADCSDVSAFRWSVFSGAFPKVEIYC
ncbi:unnamed protein product, partial [Nesidiocoris tenuis]